MAANGTRFGGWLLNTADNRYGPIGDLDGDGRAEIPVSSPWGVGVLKQSGTTLANPMLAPNGTWFGGWLLNTADNQIGIGEQLVRLHCKILTNPTISIDQMLVAMYRVYEAVGVRVHRVSTETLNLPALNDVDVGNCPLGNANNGRTDPAIRKSEQCRAKRRGRLLRPEHRTSLERLCDTSGRTAGAVVARGATQWTLGHEVGHVLTLRHVTDNNRLMTGNGAANITNPPPDLATTEVLSMRASRLTHPTCHDVADRYDDLADSGASTMTVTMNDVRAQLDPDEPNYDAAVQPGAEALPVLEQLVRGDDDACRQGGDLASRSPVITGWLFWTLPPRLPSHGADRCRRRPPQPQCRRRRRLPTPPRRRRIWCTQRPGSRGCRCRW